jgi:hypothetical protein
MSGRAILRLGFPTVGMLALAAGFLTVGMWAALIVMLPALAAWYFAVRRSSVVAAAAGLVLSVGLAAAGLLLAAPAATMMLGAACALGAWDIVLFQRPPAVPAGAAAPGAFERRHYISLAAALGVGLAIAVAGPLLAIRISFWWTMALVALALAGLEGLRRGLWRGEKRRGPGGSA